MFTTWLFGFDNSRFQSLHSFKNNVVRNFDKFELEEKLLLVCLYNFELGSKTTPSLFIYIYIYFELGAKRL